VFRKISASQNLQCASDFYVYLCSGSNTASKKNFLRKCQTKDCIVKLESSQSPHTSAKTMLFAMWQHHLWFVSGFPYASLKAMVTKISVIQNPEFLPDHPQN